jgi:hypothetical protein
MKQRRFTKCFEGLRRCSRPVRRAAELRRWVRWKSPEGNMKHHTGIAYSAILGALAAALCVTLVIPGLCIGGLWLSTRPKSKIELLWPLTTPQRQCVEQIIGSSKPVYVEKQADGESIGIGYTTTGTDYYVAIFSVDQSGVCEVAFQKEVWNCYDEFLETYREDTRAKPKKIALVELTGSEPSEVYIWFDTRGRWTGAKHVFYIEQPDGAYEEVMRLRICSGLSSVEIRNEGGSTTVMVQDDRLCDSPKSNKQNYTEYSLITGEPEIIRQWKTGEGP